MELISDDITIKNGVWWLLGLVISGLGILTLAGFFSRLSHFLDICDHYRAHYFILLALAAGFGLLGGQWLLAGAAALLAGINLLLLIPLYLRPAGSNGGQAEYRLLLANVLRTNRSFKVLVDLARAESPDFIALIEPDQAWMDALDQLRDRYPFWQVVPRLDNYGLAFLSRFPILNQFVLNLTEKQVPTLFVTVDSGSGALTFIVTHPPPPKNQPDLVWRDRQMIALSEQIKRLPRPLILCGDFNATPWSVTFRRMARQSGLRDSSRGFGLQPSWPVDRPILRVPIDHCLLSPGIGIKRRVLGPQIGSDHFPIILDFCV